MSGTILGQDQIDKVNAAYGKLVAHVREVLTKTATPFEKMKAYLAVEYLNTTELALIFERLPFISPAEKRALVRAAIDDVRLTGNAGENEATPEIPADALNTDNAGVTVKVQPEELKKFTPPPFKLNVATTQAHNVI